LQSTEQPFDSTIDTNLDDGNGEVDDETNLGNVKNAKKPRQTLDNLAPMEEEKQASSSKDDTIVESGILVSSIEEYIAFR
jgi:hypothetical protein